MRAAASPFPVVIEGESGCGKELAARAIHARSARRDKRFCADQLRGARRRARRGRSCSATRAARSPARSTDRAGLFEDANGGTLFLDEVGELRRARQAKLLRVLQEGEVRRVGETIVAQSTCGSSPRPTGRSARRWRSGAFRADLWYRLDVIRITLPPLRERLEDVPLLVAHFWRERSQARTGSRARRSVRRRVAALGAYDWPGNVRELQNVLASLLVSTPRGGLIGPSALPAHVARAAALEPQSTLAAARRQFEERYVRAALARAGGRTIAAARELGLEPSGPREAAGAARHQRRAASRTTLQRECTMTSVVRYLIRRLAADHAGAARRRDAGVLR